MVKKMTDTDRAISAIKKALELTKEAKIKDCYVGLIGSYNMTEDALTQALTTLERVGTCVHEVIDHVEPPRQQLSFNFDC